MRIERLLEFILSAEPYRGAIQNAQIVHVCDAWLLETLGSSCDFQQACAWATMTSYGGHCCVAYPPA